MGFQVLPPGDAANIRQIGLPPRARPRRLTHARVAAVCVQLAEHVSVRNVQRVLGGSLRDVAPMVRAWREDQAVVDAALASSDSTQALGAIVLASIDDLRREMVDRRDSPASAELSTTARRLQQALDRQQRMPEGLAQQSAVDAQFRTLAVRLDSLTRSLEVERTGAPLPADPQPALDHLRAQLEDVGRGMAALLGAPASPDLLEQLLPALSALGGRLDELEGQLRVRTRPRARQALPKALEARLAALEALLVRMTEQLAAKASRRRPAKRPARATSKAKRTAKKKPAVRKPPPQRRAATRTRSPSTGPGRRPTASRTKALMRAKARKKVAPKQRKAGAGSTRSRAKPVARTTAKVRTRKRVRSSAPKPTTTRRPGGSRGKHR